MKGVPRTTDDIFECDACGHEVSGYSRKELERELDWQWHPAGRGRDFVICGECVHEYAKRRALKAEA